MKLWTAYSLQHKRLVLFHSLSQNQNCLIMSEITMFSLPQGPRLQNPVSQWRPAMLSNKDLTMVVGGAGGGLPASFGPSTE